MTAVCPICPRHCRLDEGQTGFCRARVCENGTVRAKNAGCITAMALDPIEKKPLMRFHPGSVILSVGSYGCNLRCPFCQNSDISMADDHCLSDKLTPAALVSQAVALASRGNIGLAYTYNEPLVGYEFVLDCAKRTHGAGLLNVLVTNGYICPQPLGALLPYIDAMNIDLKGFTEPYYHWLGGDLETVKETIRLAAKACHVEITTLIVPGKNDLPETMEAEAAWLAGISRDIPLHITRFFPRYQLTQQPPTPIATIQQLQKIAAAQLRYVFTGNC